MPTLYPDAEARRRTVLVAVVNNMDDLRRAASAGWYRIPQRTAPRRIGADYLAFYQTGAFKDQDEAQTVTYYAPDAALSPADAPANCCPMKLTIHANDYYFRIDIGPLQRLERPLPSAKFHRVTFIHTTLDCLLAAQDVSELFLKNDPFETLWHALREHQLRPLKNRVVGERPVDITLRARGGYLGIHCTDDAGTQEIHQPPLPERWELLHLSTTRIQQDLNDCLRQIGAALINLGGSVLNQA